jgi:hypothetical protein
VQCFFEALSAAEIDASQQALQGADQQRELVLASRRQQLARLRYQAQRAERQYQQADPENRLVAAELEQRWEYALRELKAEEERQPQEDATGWAIPEDLMSSLKDAGRRLPELWNSGVFTTAQKKRLLRSLIDKVVLQRIGGSKGDRIDVRIIWRGGASTRGEVVINVAQFSQMQNAKEMEQSILKLSKDGFSAPSIARQLTQAGFRSPKSHAVLASTVQNVLKRNGILNSPKSRPVRVTGYLTISQLATTLGIRRQWFLEQIFKGSIRIEKDASTGSYLFPDNQQTLAELQQLHEGKLHNLVYL